MKQQEKGALYRIAGPIVVATGLHARMYDVVRVGNEKLMGEVIQIEGEKIVIQVYEDTSGIRPGEGFLSVASQIMPHTQPTSA